MKTCETRLPAGYRLAGKVDAGEKRFVRKLTLWAAGVMAVLIAAGALLYRPQLRTVTPLKCFLFAAGYLAYIVLHELAHGAVYALLTRHKLTFGFNLSVAYCGVKDIFVYRKTALLSLLAPFVLFGALFGTLAAVTAGTEGFLWFTLLAVHTGGCAGDVYDTFLFLNRYRDPSVLMRDTGPAQFFYQKENRPA